MPTCGINSHFFRGVSTTGFEHSHPLSDVILKCLVLAALPANGNKDNSVKGVVGMSEEVQEHEEISQHPERLLLMWEWLDPEWFGSWWKQWGMWRQFVPGAAAGEERRKQLQHCPRTSHVPRYSFQGVWQGYSNMGMLHSMSSKTLSEPPEAPNTGATGQCNALQWQNFSQGHCSQGDLANSLLRVRPKGWLIDHLPLSSTSHPLLLNLCGSHQKEKQEQPRLSCPLQQHNAVLNLHYPTLMLSQQCPKLSFKSAFSFLAS